MLWTGCDRMDEGLKFVAKLLEAYKTAVDAPSAMPSRWEHPLVLALRTIRLRPLERQCQTPPRLRRCAAQGLAATDIGPLASART